MIIFIRDSKTKKIYPLEYNIREKNYVSLLKETIIDKWKLNKSPLFIELVYHNEILEDSDYIPEDTNKHNYIIVKYNDEQQLHEQEKYTMIMGKNVSTWLLTIDTYFNDIGYLFSKLVPHDDDEE